MIPTVHALDILGDPVRRRLVELLAAGELAAGDASRIVEREFGISQPAVSRHLRILREVGFVGSRAEGARRIYRLEPLVIDELQAQVDRYRALWNRRMDALDTEIARGKRERKETKE